MRKDYKGIVIEESLRDNKIINRLNIEKVEISRELRWHMYTVRISKREIDGLKKTIRPKWYMHFWKGKKIIAIFKDKKFEFNVDDERRRRTVIGYGMSLGIPEEQLDFPIG
jgi:hypothetical protein